MLVSLLSSLLVLAPTAPQDEGSTLAWLEDLEVNAYGSVIVSRDSVRIRDEDGDPIDDRWRAQKFDVDFLAPISSHARAVVRLGLDEAGDNDSDADLEEGYVEVLDPWRSDDSSWGWTLRFGKFRSRWGSGNERRIFQTPEPTRPPALVNFLGYDGYVQSGVSGELHFPMPEEHRLSWVIEAVDSGDIPITPVEDGQAFTTATTMEWHWTIDEGRRLSTGLSGFRGPKFSPQSHMAGFDITYQSDGRHGAPAMTIGGETFTTWLDAKGVPSRNPAGFYAFCNVQASSSWYLGIRFDKYDDLVDGDLGTEIIGFYATYAYDANLRFAWGWEHGESEVPEFDDSNAVMFSVDFGIGTSPQVPDWLGL